MVAKQNTIKLLHTFYTQSVDLGPEALNSDSSKSLDSNLREAEGSMHLPLCVSIPNDC